MRALAGACALVLLAAACSGSSSNDPDEFVSRSGPSVLATDDAAAATPASTSQASESDATDEATPAPRTQPLAAASATCNGSTAVSAAYADLTGQLGVEEALIGMRGHALAAGDVNGDGHVDVFVGGFADRRIETYQVRGADGPAPDRLLLGSENGFSIDPGFPEMFGRTSGAAFADLDGDADLDLVIARNPRGGERADAPSEILVNDGGRFTERIVLDDSRGLRSVGVLDYDGDFLLDLFLVEDRFSGGDSILLRNGGSMSFTDVTEAAGLPRGLAGLGVAAADLDRSGTPDLFVAGDNRLFVNTGGRFEERDGPFGWPVFSDEDDVAGVAVGDVNGDGWLDLLVGHHYNSTLDQGRSVAPRLYLNQGSADGLAFDDVTEQSGITPTPTKAPHVELVDLDGDGALDILTSASAGGGAVPAVMMSSGGSSPTFSAPDGLGDRQYWVAGATIDVDGDASPEIFAVEWEPALGSRIWNGPDTAGGHVAVRVAGPGNGVGSLVEFRAAGQSAVLAAMPIASSTGYGSGAPPVARMGTGAATAVDVTIIKPWGRGEIEVRGLEAGSSVIVDDDGTWSCVR